MSFLRASVIGSAVGLALVVVASALAFAVGPSYDSAEGLLFYLSVAGTPLSWLTFVLLKVQVIHSLVSSSCADPTPQCDRQRSALGGGVRSGGETCSPNARRSASHATRRCVRWAT